MASEYQNGNILLSPEELLALIDRNNRNPDADITLRLKWNKDGTLGIADKKDKNINKFGDGKILLSYYRQIYPEIFEIVEDYDREYFLVHLSDTIFENSALTQEFEKMYREAPQDYYRAAVASKYYDYSLFNSGNILVDYSLKRIFSVLCYAEIDSNIRTRVEKIFYSFDPKLKELINKKSYSLASRLDMPQYGAGLTNITVHIYAYLLVNKYGIDGSALVNYFLASATKTDEFCRTQGNTGFIERLYEKHKDGYKDGWAVSFCHEASKLLMSLIRSFDDILVIAAANDYFNGIEPQLSPINKDLGKAIVGFLGCPKGNPIVDEVYELTSFCATVVALLNNQGYLSTRILRGVELNGEEWNTLLASFNIENLRRGKGETVPLTLSKFAAALIIYLFTKNISETKKVFFENNSETMFSTVSELLEKIEKLARENNNLKVDIDTAQEECTNLVRQIEALNSEKRKEEKDIISPYLDELARQRAEIESLKKQLKEEQEKDNELHALREFAFDTQSEYVPENTTVDFNESITGKKVVVIGGHINWRNKLKKKYPELIIYDGRTETADITPLRSADFVFLNVSNMSHGMYYKVIDVLRESNIAYDYLGRTINQELYEKEMADILTRHKKGQNT